MCALFAVLICEIFSIVYQKSYSRLLSFGLGMAHVCFMATDTTFGLKSNNCDPNFILFSIHLRDRFFNTTQN